MSQQPSVYSVNDCVVTTQDTQTLHMREMVYVGPGRLVGEVIGISETATTIQVYEQTAGLRVGDAITPTGAPMRVRLGPGILSGIFDGIQRPLSVIAQAGGGFIPPGVSAPPLDEEKLWPVTITVAPGGALTPGMVFATCPETAMIQHRAMVPPGVSGQVIRVVEDGDYTISTPLVFFLDENGQERLMTLAQEWPIRTPRPVAKRLPLDRPLITGQRVIDTFFPVAKGGAAAIPGGFGTGKTMTQHQLARWSDADIIIYIGCGERGNEMTQVLQEFAELKNPANDLPLSARTVLIANTSNMPVAAREASIYTGITLGEYYRDMGYHVAMMADSTSRWAEALREISGRLAEMPAEEGFPPYLPSRLAEFYERAGYMQTLSGREGSITLIGAVSPQGGDFSEPVTQNTKRFVRTFWALDRNLAYSRHYPAVYWMDSYSEYIDDLTPWYAAEVSPDMMPLRQQAMTLLQEENKLMEIVKLVGEDILPDEQRLTLIATRLLRVGFLQQNAYHPEDTYVPLPKQRRMLQAILHFYDTALPLVATGTPIRLVNETGLPERLVRMKYDIPNGDEAAFDALSAAIDEGLGALVHHG